MSDTPSQEMVINHGCLVRVVEFRTIKLLTAVLAILLFTDISFSLKLFVSAIKIRSHLGYFINMVSSGDGETLPSMQAVPVLFFLIIDVFMVYFVYAVFDDLERVGLNRLMFFTGLLAAIMLVIIVIVVISVLVHAYAAHESLHDGIVTAMKDYSNNTAAKAQIDRLQIEFQCCGSKKYDEWYTIKWAEASLQRGGGAAADGNTPFSCCSMRALAPCIHHNIEVTGKAYQYTPEFNLSVSTRGCYEMIREKKQEIGWAIVGNLCLYLLLQMVTSLLFRFLQTAHFQRAKFVGNVQQYTIWAFGSYAGKVKKDGKEPPKVPPVPAELKN